MSKPSNSVESPREAFLILSRRALTLVLLCSAMALWIAFKADDSALDFVGRHSDEFSRWLACEVSLLGDWYGVAAIGLLGWWMAARRKSLRWRRLWLSMGVCAALGGVSANVIRTLSGRARPHSGAPAGWYGPSKARHPVKSSHAFQSFPSAHTSVVAGFLAPVGWVALRRKRGRCLFVGMGLSVSGTALMAWSRVWLGAHHLSDVLAASLLGWGIALVWIQYRAPDLIKTVEKPDLAAPC